MAWEIEIADPSFERFYSSLSEVLQVSLTAAFEGVLARDGIDICSTGWGRPLGQGLYEFRISKSPNAILEATGRSRRVGGGFDRPVLLRVFCAFHGQRVIVVFHGYDKAASPSKRHQAKEIATARRLYGVWRCEGRR